MPEDEPTPLDLDEISALLGPEGPLAGPLEGSLDGSSAKDTEGLEYEDRAAQQELLRLVGSGFNDGKIIVAEGGTGIGKSFAYLLPAAFWALRNKQRVVVSTATINLQQQLLEKDLPLLGKISGLGELRAELVKGRSNYLCRRRLKQAEEEEGSALVFDEPESELFGSELASIGEWAKVTSVGSRHDLGFQPRSRVWKQVCGERDNCLGPRCEFYESCFIILARRRAAAAHILVTNHHVLFADLELRGGGEFGYEKTAVLPPYRHVVVDEAHNMERSAQSLFSESLGRFSARRSLRRLYHRLRQREGGIWPQLRQYAQLEAADELPDILASSDAVETALVALDRGAKAVLAECRVSAPSHTLRLPEQNLSAVLRRALAEQLRPPLQKVSTALLKLLNSLRQVYDLLKNVLEGEEKNLLLEWQQLSRRFKGLHDLTEHWQQRLKNYESSTPATTRVERVFWLERYSIKGEYYHRLLSAPLHIGDLLRKTLYRPMRSVVLVSATLTVRARFDYWFARVGLLADSAARRRDAPPDNPSAKTGDSCQNERDPLSLRCATFASPFDYRHSVHLLLASDAPSPSQSRDYNDYVANFASRAVRSMGGRSLLLFTSYAALNNCYNFLAGDLELLRQGDDDSSRLLQRFKAQESLSLLATDSFWEGVDAPGLTLTQVLLCRLPFRSPEDPIVAANTEYLARRGENAFFGYSLPEAILRFRQGFGRLMRRVSDRGLVVVLDPRIVHKNYGQDFLNSLPPTKIVSGNFTTLQQYIYDYAQESNF